MDEALEELYTLLDLYFRIETGSGIVSTRVQTELIEPSLDRVIFREKVLKRIVLKSKEVSCM